MARRLSIVSGYWLRLFNYRQGRSRLLFLEGHLILEFAGGKPLGLSNKGSYSLADRKGAKNKSCMKKILFLVNGYGLGNSARAHSLIQRLGPDCEIDVLGYGNSFKYFKRISRIRKLFRGFQIEYGARGGRIDFLSTMLKLPKNISAVLKSRRLVRGLIKSDNYSLIVSDSDYSSVFMGKRPRLISVNNANMIVKEAWKIKKRGCYFHFMAELADSLFSRLAPDLVISPFFAPSPDKGKIRQIPIMARQSFLSARSLAPEPAKARHHVLAMTGGAGLENIIIDHNPRDYDLSLLGDGIQAVGKARREKKTFDASALMARATIVVINGGFSSVSEALAMAKPMVVVPLKGHIEQKVNASWIQNSGLGLMSSWENIGQAIDQVRGNYGQLRRALLNYKSLDGAARAARIILEELENESMR